MEIELSDEEMGNLNKIGELTGVNKKEIIKIALKAYLENLRFQMETETWDKLSDEALINFEKEYE